MKIGLSCVQPRLHECLELVLNDRGYSVETIDAKPLNSVRAIDCAIIGADFPLESAIDLCRRFRDSLPPEVPLLVLGPWLDVNPVNDILSAGAADYLPAAWHARELDLRLQVLAHRVRRPIAIDTASPCRVNTPPRLDGIELPAGSVAHDVNNMLAAILGNAELALLDMPSPSPARHSIEHMARAARHAVELMAQLMDHVRRPGTQAAPVNLAKLVQEMAELLRATLSRRCRLELEFEPDLPLIWGDRSQLRQVALNLLINASDAIGDRFGEIHVSVSLRNAKPGQQVVLTVKDSGEGIDDDIRARIFDPCFTTKPGGYGLGLATVRQIALAHGGAIEVESQPDRGSVFTVAFPVALQSASDRPAAIRQQHRGTVLLVDSDPAARSEARKLLRGDGFTVLDAESCDEALDLLGRYHSLLNAVILDLDWQDGTALLHRLREIGVAMQVVVWSAMDESRARQSANSVGFAGFVSKPAPDGLLVETLRRVLKQP